MAKRQNRPAPPDSLDPDDVVAVFGANVKARRLKLGLTQAQLAEQSGLLQQYVSLVELGKQNVTLETAQIMAKVLGRHLRAMLSVPGTQRPTRKD